MVTDEEILEVSESGWSTDDSVPDEYYIVQGDEKDEISPRRLAHAFELARYPSWRMGHRGPEPTQEETVMKAPGFYCHQRYSGWLAPRYVKRFMDWVREKEMSNFEATNLICYRLHGQIALAVSQHLHTNFKGYKGILDFVVEVAKRGTMPAWLTTDPGRPDPFRRDPRSTSYGERMRQMFDHIPSSAAVRHPLPVPKPYCSADELRVSVIELQDAVRFLMDGVSAVAVKQRKLLYNLEKINIDDVARRVELLHSGQRDLAMDLLRLTRKPVEDDDGVIHIIKTAKLDSERLATTADDHHVSQVLREERPDKF